MIGVEGVVVVVVVESSSIMIFPASMADWIATLINFVLVVVVADNKGRSSSSKLLSMDGRRS